MIKEIVEKIIALLKADADLNFDWFFEPPIRAPKFPYGFVDFRGGAEAQRGGAKTLYNWTYYIVMVDRKRSDTDSIERMLFDRTEKAVNILKSNYTLDGLVENSRVTAIEGDYAVTDRENFIGSRITLTVWVWV